MRPKKYPKHLIHQLYDKSLNGYNKNFLNRAQKSIFVWSFKCYREDEYNGLVVEDVANEENPEPSQQPPIYACKFGEGNKYGHVLVLANEEGKIGIQNTEHIGKHDVVKGYQVHNNAIFDVCWIPGCAELVSVSGDQSARLSAIREDGTLETTLSLTGHSRSIKTVHVNPFDPCVIATGARDGNIIIWDKRCKPHHKADEIAPAHYNSNRGINSPSVRKMTTAVSTGNNSVTSVVFQNQHTLISSGASDGLLKLWDLRKSHGGSRRDPQSQHQLEHGGNSSHRGFTSLTVSPQRDILYASCMDNTVYAYHLANPTVLPVAEYIGHINLTYFVKSCLSPCGNFLLSGSSDNCAYIWLTDRPGKPVAVLTGHFAEVTSVAWCPVNREKLVTCADDMKHRIFRLRNTNEDDFDQRMNMRGKSEPYKVELLKSQKNSNTVDNKEDTSSRERNNSEASNSGSLPALPPMPVTPSSSRYNSTRTPGSNRIGTPRAQLLATPQRRQSSGRATPCTPKTSERGTLLQWLSGTKTPSSNQDQDSPSVSGLMVVSASKKAGLKRKLTDLLEENQENDVTKDKKKSPTATPFKNILVVSAGDNSPVTSPSTPSAAKMLKYENSECKYSNNLGQPMEVSSLSTETSKSLPFGVGDLLTAEINDCVKPIESPDSNSIHSAFRKPVTNAVTRIQEFEGNSSSHSPPERSSSSICPNLPSKSSNCSNSSSPTANLPNFVIDGRSPHSRPKNIVVKKKDTDWLTSLRHQRKLKFTRTPDKLTAQKSSTITSLMPKTTKKILTIKPAKIRK